MSRLSKEKRDRLILVSLGIAIVLAGLWFGLIGWQRQNLKLAEDRKEKAQLKLEQIKKTSRNALQIESELAELSADLSYNEGRMASGDLAVWMIRTIKQLSSTFNVDIPQFSTTVVEPTSLLAGFPYQQVKMTISGTAYYDDFGRFIAELENRFPHMRAVNLSLTPAPSQMASDSQKLMFKVDIVALVKPGA